MVKEKVWVIVAMARFAMAVAAVSIIATGCVVSEG